MVCIYILKVDKHFYFGQTVNFANRRRQHLNALRSRTHWNPRLQNAFNKYGESGFSMRVHKECGREQLQKLEHEVVTSSIDEYHCCNLVTPLESGGNLYTSEMREKCQSAWTPEMRAEAGRRASTYNQERWKSQSEREKLSSRSKEWWSGMSKSDRRKRAEAWEASNPQLREVLVNYPDGSCCKFKSASEACRVIGMDKRSFIRRINGKKPWPTKNGFRFSGYSANYVDEPVTGGY